MLWYRFKILLSPCPRNDALYAYKTLITMIEKECLRVPSCYWHVKANFCVVLYFVKTDGRINGVSFQKLATCFVYCLEINLIQHTLSSDAADVTRKFNMWRSWHIFQFPLSQLRGENSCKGIKAELALSDITTIGGRRRRWCCNFLDFGQTYTTKMNGNLNNGLAARAGDGIFLFTSESVGEGHPGKITWVDLCSLKFMRRTL